MSMSPFMYADDVRAVILMAVVSLFIPGDPHSTASFIMCVCVCIILGGVKILLLGEHEHAYG